MTTRSSEKRRTGGDARARVLVINQYFPPDTSATAAIFSDVAQALSEEFRVRVLCGRPSYRPTDRRPWRLTATEVSGAIEIQRVGSTGFSLDSFLGRIANYLSFLALSSAHVLLSRRPSIVLCGTDPPAALLPALIAARGRPIVYHLQDLHPEAAVAAGWMRQGRLERIWEQLHRRALRKCALIVCLGRDMADLLSAKGVSPTRLLVVPNGAPPAVPPDDPDLVSRIRNGAAFAIVHAGNIGVAGPWNAIAEAARLTADEASVVFVGRGVHEGILRSTGVRIERYSPDIGAVMQAGDVQLVTQRNDMRGFLVPSKLYTALAHGRPILAVVPENSEVAATVREWNCGLVANPDDPADIATKIRTLARSPETLAEMAERAKIAGQHYERPGVFAPLIAAIRTLDFDAP